MGISDIDDDITNQNRNLYDFWRELFSLASFSNRIRNMLSAHSGHASPCKINIRINILAFSNSKCSIFLCIMNICIMSTILSNTDLEVPFLLEFEKVFIIFFNVTFRITIEFLKITKVDLIFTTSIVHIIQEKLLLLMDCQLLAVYWHIVFLFLHFIVDSPSYLFAGD